MPVTPAFIERRIHLIRGQKVIVDVDLAELYQVSTKRLNEQVKRNSARFPLDFMFQLNKSEADSLRSQFATSNEGRGGRRYLPYAFTELGVAMLSSVLNSEKAVQMNIFIMRAFVKLRQMISSNKDLASKVDKLELEQIKQGMGLAELFSYVRQFMDTSVPEKHKLGFEKE
ncbi:MAG: ORF6N domain-containing protein [Candidatus Taylorbacteria bacterium]|nr:ORF6N domain-containing protein [Candidatus Taylorbacteria bacterium]